MDDAKRQRVAKAKVEADERRIRALKSLALCLGRSDVMRLSHDLMVREAYHDPEANTRMSTDAAMLRFTTYVMYWFAGLSAVIERYQELATKGTIPRDPTLDGLLGEEWLALVKPFRNAVAHCTDYDDVRVMSLMENAATVPDWAAAVSHEFRAYFARHGVGVRSADPEIP